MRRFTEDELIFLNYAYTRDLSETEQKQCIQNLDGKDIKILFDDNDEADSNALIRQYYIHKQLENRKLEDTELRTLLENLKQEMEHQYIRKTQIETRAGFLMALWGIIFTAFLQVYSAIVKNTIGEKMEIIITVGVVTAGVLIVGIISLIYLCRCIWSNDFCFFNFHSRKNNIVASIEYPNLMLMRWIEGYSNSYIKNEEILHSKGKLFNKAIIVLCCYITLVGVVLSVLYVMG